MRNHLGVCLVLLLAVSASAAEKKKKDNGPVTTCEPVPQGTAFVHPAAPPTEVSVLWYRQPAKKWVEALPVGNGSFGAMVFGGVTKDVVQFNHDTIWTKPRMPDRMDYKDPLPDKSAVIEQARKLIFAGQHAEAEKLVSEEVLMKGYQWGSYQPFATLAAEYELNLGSGVAGYRNELDMATGIVRTRFSVAGTEYLREVFVCNRQNLIVMHMVARGPGHISGKFTLERDILRDEYKPRTVAADKISFASQGDAPGVQFESIVQAIAEGGAVTSAGGVLSVKGAKALTILISGATDYNKQAPYVPLEGDLADRCNKLLAAFTARGLESTRQEAVAEHRTLYERVNLKLGKGMNNDVPTDERIKAARSGKPDSLLAAQAYQFGRYLLICSSRPGSMPANLQGLWNDRVKPPWHSDYHFNINVQMNYWMAESANLSECHLPFFDLLQQLVPGGKRVASEMFHCRGFMVSHATGGYFTTIPNGGPPYALWTMGGAWGVQHVMEHYRFSGDKGFLKDQGLGLLREAALFCLDWLVENPQTGKLVAGPNVSPELFFVQPNGTNAALDMGCAMDQQLIWQVFTDYLQAGKVLKVFEPEMKEVEEALKKLAPGTQIGVSGRIMEWSSDFKESSAGHRHVSHLFSFHPGNQYHKGNAPELAEAAYKTVEYRTAAGAGKMGWSAAWINCLFARFGKAEQAYNSVATIMKRNLFPNMMSIYPPDVFQIDGNFGYTLALTEMLLQSHTGEIELLPALPSAWSEGEVTGLVARGGFEISMQWKEGTLINGSIRSKLGNPCTLRYGNKTVELKMKQGEQKSLAEILGL